MALKLDPFKTAFNLDTLKTRHQANQKRVGNLVKGNVDPRAVVGVAEGYGNPGGWGLVQVGASIKEMEKDGFDANQYRKVELALDHVDAALLPLEAKASLLRNLKDTAVLQRLQITAGVRGGKLEKGSPLLGRIDGQAKAIRQDLEALAEAKGQQAMDLQRKIAAAERHLSRELGELLPKEMLDAPSREDVRGYVERFGKQQHEIAEGILSGKIDPQETSRLQAQQAHIAQKLDDLIILNCSRSVPEAFLATDSAEKAREIASAMQSLAGDIKNAAKIPNED